MLQLLYMSVFIVYIHVLPIGLNTLVIYIVQHAYVLVYQNLCTTRKYTPTQSKPKMNRPSPNASKAATPALLTLKTPQRSILKAENGNSIIKKRRVVFASDDENGSESSSSEMMEVEVSLKDLQGLFFTLVFSI